MSAVSLSRSQTVCWRPGKDGHTQIIGPIGPKEDLPNTTTSTSVSSTVALECVKLQQETLAVWTGAKSLKEIKHSSKVSKNVLYVCTDGTRSGVFYMYHRNQDIGFALLTHQLEAPQKLSAKPEIFNEELSALMANTYPSAERRPSGQEKRNSSSFLNVRSAKLQQTAQGYIVAAIISTRDADVYAVVGLLDKREWRKWSVEASLGSMPCILISTSGREVRLTRCDIRQPIDVQTAVASPSIPLALSAFDRVSSPPVAEVPQGGVHPVSHLKCVVLREKIFSTKGGTTVAECCFQSQCFELEEESVHEFPYQCLVEVDTKSDVYTIVVPCQQFSCIVHATCAFGGSVLVSSCCVVPEMRYPISLCTLCIPHVQRARGARICLILCQDLRIFGCEEFGGIVRVGVEDNDGSSDVISFDIPSGMKLSKKARQTEGMTRLTRLIPLRNPAHLLCTDGALGIFFRVHIAAIVGPEPEVAAKAASARDALNARGAVRGESAAAAVADALRNCISKLETLSQQTTRHELPDVVFKHVVPLLSFVGTTQQEVLLMQRLYERLLQIASPNLEAEWQHLWALTFILQKVLARRSKENSVCYTDQFFMALADTYRRSDFSATNGTAVVAEGLQAVVSDEVQTALTAAPLVLSAEVEYILDGLAQGVALLPLAEEVMRRMMRVDTLSNGVCVVAAKTDLASCVHAIGTALLGSCLDLTLYFSATNPKSIAVVCCDPASPSVKVPPQTFADQSSFEAALITAADLLCVASSDSSFRPDLGLLTLSVGCREHCLMALMQLLAPVLCRAAADDVCPVVSLQWFEECAACLRRSFEEQARHLLLHPASCAVSLTTTLCYSICVPDGSVNGRLFRSAAAVLPEEFCTALLVVYIFHQTERMVAAMNNYGAAIAAYLLGKEKSEQSTKGVSVDVARSRLHNILLQVASAWTVVDELSPYKVKDIAESHRLSVLSSTASPAAASSSSLSNAGTMLSRTLVQCFRLFTLVCFTDETEERLVMDTNGVADGTAKRCAEALSLAYLMRGSAVPLEWYQWRLLSLVQALPGEKWAAFCTRLLQLCNVAQTNSSASLNRKYYTMIDQLQRSRQTTSSGGGDTAGPPVDPVVQQAITRAESAVMKLTVQAEHCESSTARNGTAAAGGGGGGETCFVFSQSRDATMPRWIDSHQLQERRYLISLDWTERLWLVERVPEELQRVHDIALLFIDKQVYQQYSSQGSGLVTAQRPQSQEMARPLYDYVCRINYPVRAHAIVEKASNFPFAQQQQQPPVVERVTSESESGDKRNTGSAAVVVEEGRHYPVQLASLQHRPPGPIVTEALPMVNYHPSPREVTADPDTPPASQRKGDAEAKTVTTAPLSPHMTAPVSAFYAPEDIAWWDQLGTKRVASPAAAIPAAATEVKAGLTEDGSDQSDTATSYTTATSLYADPFATLGDFARQAFQDEDSVSSRHEDGIRHVSKNGKARPTSVSPRKKCCRCRKRYEGKSYHQPRCFTDGMWDDMSVAPRRDSAAEKPLRRPPLLSLPTRLQPPSEPKPLGRASAGVPISAQTARVRHTSASSEEARLQSTDANGEIPLLSLQPRNRAHRTEQRVRLYSTAGETLYLAAGSGNAPTGTHLGPPPFLGQPPACRSPPTSLLRPPPLPSSSVLEKPPTLLRLTRGATDRLGETAPPSISPPSLTELREAATPPSVASPPAAPVFPAATVEPSPFAQVYRPPVGPAPPPVSVASLQASNERPPPPAAAAATSSWPAPVPESTAALPSSFPKTAAPLPVPVAISPPLLSPSQMSDFRRYTDDLLAHASAAGPAPSPLAIPQPWTQTASSASLGAPLAAVSSTPGLLPSTTPTTTTTAASPGGDGSCDGGGGVTRLAQQQEEFIRRAESALQARQRENEGFYQKVLESMRSLTSTTQQLRGLSPVEQSELVRNSIKQRNELLNLNHQLLDIQVAAMRADGSAGAVNPRPSATAPPFGVPPSSLNRPPTLTTPFYSVGVNGGVDGVVTAGAATQTTPILTREAATSYDVATPATGPPSSVAHLGMQETLSDLKRLHTELLGVNASAEAMEKSIQESRELISRYERFKSAEALTAEGAALLATMRSRTLAVEQRLAELPKPPATATSTATAAGAAAARRPSSVWLSQSSTGDTTEVARGEAGGPRRFMSHEEEIMSGGGAAPAQFFSIETQPLSPPRAAVSPQQTEATLQQFTPPPPLPSTPPRGILDTSQVPTVAEATGGAFTPPPLQPSPNAAYTELSPPYRRETLRGAAVPPSVSSVQRREAEAAAVPLAFNSFSTKASVEAEVAPALSYPVKTERGTAPLDLRTVYAHAVAPRRHSPTSWRRVEVPLYSHGSAQRIPQGELSLTSSKPPTQRPFGDRFAMYRTTLAGGHRAPSHCSALVAKTTSVPVAAQSLPPRTGLPLKNTFVDRQHARRMSSIDKRMMQLEADLS